MVKAAYYFADASVLAGRHADESRETFPTHIAFVEDWEHLHEVEKRANHHGNDRKGCKEPRVFQAGGTFGNSVKSEGGKKRQSGDGIACLEAVVSNPAVNVKQINNKKNLLACAYDDDEYLAIYGSSADLKLTARQGLTSRKPLLSAKADASSIRDKLTHRPKALLGGLKHSSLAAGQLGAQCNRHRKTEESEKQRTKKGKAGDLEKKISPNAHGDSTRKSLEHGLEGTHGVSHVDIGQHCYLGALITSDDAVVDG